MPPVAYFTRLAKFQKDTMPYAITMSMRWLEDGIGKPPASQATMALPQ
jgi:hypothetical protein